jgi:hypothetical protein
VREPTAVIAGTKRDSMGKSNLVREERNVSAFRASGSGTGGVPTSGQGPISVRRPNLLVRPFSPATRRVRPLPSCASAVAPLVRVGFQTRLSEPGLSFGVSESPPVHGHGWFSRLRSGGRTPDPRRRTFADTRLWRVTPRTPLPNGNKCIRGHPWRQGGGRRHLGHPVPSRSRDVLRSPVERRQTA